MHARFIPLLLLTLSAYARAQSFSSGSDGSDGALNITNDTTLPLPPDGRFKFTTLTVAQNRTLRFHPNAANTPVYLLATGDILIAGKIDISGAIGNNAIGGAGGPGGFDGGSPGSVGVPPGSGYGPGGGRGGTGTSNADGGGGGSFSTVGSGGQSTNRGGTYGNPLAIPVVGGSGGGGTIGTPGVGGGGGGGALEMASNTRITITGTITAQGGSYGGGAYNGGSGGAIRLVAPAVGGTGQLAVDSYVGSGLGRVRIDAIDRSQLNLNYGSGAAVVSVGSLMLTFPDPLPRLDIIEAAGTAIPLGSGPVLVQLPFGSVANRTIKVQAKDFNAVVPITLMLIPDHGTPTVYTAQINNTGANNPALGSIDVVLPINEQTTVSVFSK